MSKTETDEVHDIAEDPVPSHSHNYPVVAEGTGKTAGEGSKEKTVYNAELYAALQESKIEKWSKASKHLYFSIFIAFCCACANGYDGSLMGSITAMKHFEDTFHSGLTGHKVSVMTSLYSVGSICATPFAAGTSDKWGRRTGMVCGAIGIVIGAIIAATSNTLAQITVGRFVLGAGIQFMTVAAPAYSIEIAPPHWRGRCTGFYNCGWFGGSLPAAFICFGCQYIDSDYSWKVPLILQCFTCLIVLSCVWFIPESPRYLFAKGREEEAIEFLVKYHGNGDRNSRLVLLEVEEIRESIRQEQADKQLAWWDYRPLFLTHDGRWRSSQVLMMGVFGQFSGNGLGYFNAAIFSQLGIKTTSAQLGYNILYQCLSCIGALTAMSLTDKMPRRPVLVFGTLACAITLACNAGLDVGLNKYAVDIDGTSTIVGHASYGRGALAFYNLFGVVNSFAYTPLQGVLPAEALDTTRRAKGLAFYGFLTGMLGFINTYCTPIAESNIGYKYIWVFVGWDVVESILWYFFCVEAQGRTLEELEWIYDQPNPVKASKHFDKVIVQADGTVTEKIIDRSA